MIRHGRNLPPPGGRGSQFIRLSKTGDPNAAICYGRGNGGLTLDQRAVVDGGLEKMVRLGELPVTDPGVRASLTVLDKQISVSSPSGTALVPCPSRRRPRRTR